MVPRLQNLRLNRNQILSPNPTRPVVMRDKKEKEGAMNAPHISFQEIAQVAGFVLAVFADGTEPLDPAEFEQEQDAELITLIPPTTREVFLAEAA